VPLTSVSVNSDARNLRVLIMDVSLPLKHIFLFGTGITKYFSFGPAAAHSNEVAGVLNRCG
jgi:hypothetical protein